MIFPELDLRKIADPKAFMRPHARKVREELAKTRPHAPRQAAAHFMSALRPQPGQVVSLYFPVNAELDTWPLAEALWADDITICLPVIERKDAPLIFRAYTPDMDLTEGRFGIMTPPDGALLCEPDILLCPLLAYSPDGKRLGMGGGYYDRTLAAYRARRDVTAVGYAYAGQETKFVPHGKNDQTLDWVVTERAARQARR
ncbi:MAG: 5-formyltetrahydrofolate cyclo-ligase [Aquisalinus sp.]|nr:5-formyltetrahydrofolate cyclo-ligase [Aquisalinus sp.]